MLRPLSLLSDPWLRTRTRSGEASWLSPPALLASGFDDPVLDPAWPRADFTAATLEFLIGLVSTACWERVRDPEGWEDWWFHPPSADELDAAFAPLADAFVLDGEGPRFMQDRYELGGDAIPVEALLIEAPGANTVRKNRDLFVRRDSVPVLDRTAAAMALFTLQTYAPSGGAGHRTSLRGGGPLTSLVLPPEDEKPPSLWETVWLNAYWEQDWPDPLADLARVLPWLAPTRTSEAGEITTPGDVHPAQCFWGMPRRIRLDFMGREDGTPPCAISGRADDVVVKTYRTRPHGTNYDAWYRGHPLSPYYRQKRDRPEWLPAHPQPGHGGYRDWVGLVVADADDASATRAPAHSVSQGFQRLREVESRGTARLWVGGFDMDNMTARGFLESQLPVPAVSTELQHTVEVLSRRLVWAAQQAEGLASYAIASVLTPDETKSDKGVRRVARERFWERTEPDFFALLPEATSDLEAGGDTEERREVRERCARSWLAVLERSALDLFDAFVPPTDIGALDVRRVVEARRTLHGALRGYGAGGKRLFEAIQLPRPETKSKKEKAA